MTARIPLTVVIAIHVVISATLAWILNVWADESCTLYATDGSLAFVCDKALHFEWQPPVYHLALSLWRQLDGGVFFARCFSIACTSVTIVAIWQAAKALGVQQPVLPAALFGFHPFAIYLATEIRLYGFATMIGALMLCTMIQTYWLFKKSRPPWGNTSCIALGLFTNILLGIPLAAQTVSILLFRRSCFPRFVLWMLPVLAAFAPMLWYQLSLAESTELLPADNTPVNLAMYLLGSWQYILFPLPRTDATLLVRVMLLALLVLTAACITYRFRSRLVERHALLATYTAVCYVGLAAFVFLTHVARTERYCYILVPPTVVLWAMLLELVDSGRVRGVLYATSLLLCAVSLVIVYEPLAKSGDWSRVAEYLESTAEPGEPIVVFPSEVQTLLNYYDADQNQIVAIPGPQRFDRFRMSDFRIPDRETLDRVLGNRLQQASSLMLITYNPAIFRSEGEDLLNFQLLESYLASDFSEVNRTDFLDTTIRKYQRK